MAAAPKFLTDEQWAKIGPLLPWEKPGSKGGRPPAPRNSTHRELRNLLRCISVELFLWTTIIHGLD
jgi:hypothetical protein